MSLSISLRKLPVTSAAALLLLGLIVMAVIVGPFLSSVGPNEIVGDIWEPIGGAYLLGTDQLGRDMLMRLLIGGRTSIALAAASTAVAFILGVGFGLVAALFGGWVDVVLSRFVDLLMSFPRLIFALIAIAILGSSIPVLLVVLGVLEGLGVFRLTRALAMKIATQEYVDIARLRGEGASWIVLHEMLPNAIIPLSSELTMRFVFCLLLISSLSFLGLGVPPSIPDWGGMVRENSQAIALGLMAPLVPAVMIATVAICAALIADPLPRGAGPSSKA